MTEITMTLNDLRDLLDEQIQLTINKLKSESYIYNKESTMGSSKSLPIDEDKMFKVGRETKYPNEYNVLKKYLTNQKS